MIKHLIDGFDSQFTDVSVSWFGQAHQLFCQGGIWDNVNFTDGLKSLTFEETLLTDRFKKQRMNKWLYNLRFEFIELLMCKYLS